jgi:cyclophilin family peptidyl-prolyl cis-trans isomerase/HEAT repeat protein
MIAPVPRTAEHHGRATGGLVALIVIAAGCATAPRVVPVVVSPFDEKVSWVLRLEDQRVLGDPPLPAAPAAPEDPSAPLSPPPAVPNLLALLADPEPQIRRRAALAIGRVGLPEGVAPLISALSDAQVEVRQMVAFALGLIGDETATDALVAALADPAPLVQGRAAQALGRIGSTRAAPSVGVMVRSHVTATFDIEPEDLSYPQSEPAEAFRLGLYALGELGAYEPLAEAVLAESGQPIVWWWPVAAALRMVGDPRALAPLTALAGVQGSIGPAVAINGLGELGDRSSVELLVKQLDPSFRDERVVISALRALGDIGDVGALPAVRKILLTPGLDRSLLLAATETLGTFESVETTNIFIELVSHPWAPLRVAALQALARTDPGSFLLMLSGLDPDPVWTVRAALASALEFIEPDAAVFRLTFMLEDEDQRVVPAVLTALARHRAPDIAELLFARLQSADIVVRKTAATLIGELRPAGGAERLAAAFEAATADPSYLARGAIVDALAAYGGPVASETLRRALQDPDWAVRVVAARRVAELDPRIEPVPPHRPAPVRQGVDHTSPHLVSPAVSPHVYLELDAGTIQIELNVIDAPLTADNFVTLARQGFYDGLTFHRVVPNYVIQGGDPRGDSEGGPGFTIRDELNQVPYLRGTVGMALDWGDTGGSQFFITHSPQPHLDGRHTAFGQVVAGMDVVDRVEVGDEIRRVLVWDGVQPLQSADQP